MIKHIQPISNASASDLLAQAYPQIKRDFGALVEPFTLHA
nr:alkylhydroperoxidase [Chloroflexota bacterium]